MVKRTKKEGKFIHFQKEKKSYVKEIRESIKMLQAPPYSLGGYSHRERWSRTR
jgi:hypothetical protein